MASAKLSQPWPWHITQGPPSKSPSGTAVGAILRRTGLPTPGCAVLCPLPAFLWGQASWDTSGWAGLWGGLHSRGKCSAEHLPSALTQCPDVAALRVFRSFLSLPYCPTFRRVCTGGSHHPLFPSVGLASPHGVLLPGFSTEGHILQVQALEREAGRAAAAMFFVGRRLSQPQTG